MEWATNYYRRKPKKIFDYLEEKIGLHFTIGDKSNLIRHLESSWHNDDMNAIWLDAYLYLREIGYNTNPLNDAIKEGIEFCKEFAKDKREQSKRTKERRQ